LVWHPVLRPSMHNANTAINCPANLLTLII
jgi:hypothetical protein